jgi:hypothetical protein
MRTWGGVLRSRDNNNKLAYAGTIDSLTQIVLLVLTDRGVWPSGAGCCDQEVEDDQGLTLAHSVSTEWTLRCVNLSVVPA